jgi:hypothetical protein
MWWLVLQLLKEMGVVLTPDEEIDALIFKEKCTFVAEENVLSTGDSGKSFQENPAC